MARIARVVAEGVPHHVTQRGNRRQATFFGNDDYVAYLRLLTHWTARFDVQVWAYCLMPNHVHLILVPARSRDLARCIGEIHRRYTTRIHRRYGWKGYLWQGRFASFPMDEDHLVAAARYVLFNPVRAHLVNRPEQWPYSSAGAHLGFQHAPVSQSALLNALISDWRQFLEPEHSTGSLDERIRLHSRTGRPLGSEGFMERLERQLGRVLRPGKRGPRPNPK